MAKVGLEARLSQLLERPILQLSLKPMNGTVGVFIYSAHGVFPREGGCHPRRWVPVRASSHVVHLYCLLFMGDTFLVEGENLVELR